MMCRLFLFAQSFITDMCMKEQLILHRQPFLLPRKPQTCENDMRQEAYDIDIEVSRLAIVCPFLF